MHAPDVLRAKKYLRIFLQAVLFCSCANYCDLFLIFTLIRNATDAIKLNSCRSLGKKLQSCIAGATQTIRLQGKLMYVLMKKNLDCRLQPKILSSNSHPFLIWTIGKVAFAAAAAPVTPPPPPTAPSGPSLTARDRPPSPPGLPRANRRRARPPPPGVCGCLSWSLGSSQGSPASYPLATRLHVK